MNDHHTGAELIPSGESLSLYLHIPFCAHRCSYCDFNTYTSLGDLKEAYAAALADEIRQVSGDSRRAVHTIFFGGGTPSLMSVPSLEQILAAVRAGFDLSPAAEITMEANPNTVDVDYLAAVRALGVNRLSFGVQSAVAGELALLDRQHDFATAAEAMAMARTSGFDNINIDLIYGVPGQTLASWEESLRAVLALEPTHLSCYCLTVEEGTPMARWLKNGRIEPPDPDLAADQYEFACHLLAKTGFHHYEISNWTLPGQACEHNLTYWRNGDYLGLGAGAHGHAAGYRYHVVRQPRVYIRRLRDANGEAVHYPWSTAVAGKHQLTQKEAMADTVITQLRLLDEGLDLAAFARRFGTPLHLVYGQTINDLQSWDLLKEQNGRLLLSERGRFLSNQVFYRFI